MENVELDRRSVVKRFGLLGAVAAALGLAKGVPAVRAGDEEENDTSLVGMWDVTVNGFKTYYYTYAVSRGAFAATGNIDANWDGLGSSFGPTMGSYERVGRRSYGIREKAWSFDPQGNPAGRSEFVGTYVVDRTGKSLTGGGTWTLYDVEGNTIFGEPLTVTGTRA